MYRLYSQIHQSNGAPVLSPYSPSSSSSYSSSNSASSSSDSSSGNSRISPAIIFIIVILSVVFFILGTLHLLVRFLMRQRSSSSSSVSQSNRYPDMSESDAYQRQLQQLFHLHDSGLDQAFIDALPVFLYKEIIGLKEPFDCAVCLCEFLEQDKLRLLPNCNHAFHIDCIDTWLLSNSTCPICRGTLYAPGFSFETPFFDFEGPCYEEEDGVSVSGFAVNGAGSSNKPAENHITNGKRVFSVRLGKFRSSNNNAVDGVDKCEGESSNSSISISNSNANMDARRCYSMGSYQYIVADSDLRVALCPSISGSMRQLIKGRIATTNGNNFSSTDVDAVEGKKISNARKGESFSVSKIWQWSRKDNSKLASSSEAQIP